METTGIPKKKAELREINAATVWELIRASGLRFQILKQDPQHVRVWSGNFRIDIWPSTNRYNTQKWEKAKYGADLMLEELAIQRTAALPKPRDRRKTETRTTLGDSSCPGPASEVPAETHMSDACNAPGEKGEAATEFGRRVDQFIERTRKEVNSRNYARGTT